jgi:PKD repeat protein
MLRKTVAGSTIAAIALMLTQVLGMVNAAAAIQTTTLSFSGSAPARTIVSVGGGYGNIFSANAAVSAGLSWQSADQVATNYTDDNLRQGSQLDLANTITPGAGSVAVNYEVTGNLSAATFDQTVTDSFPCALPLAGDAANSCSDTTSVGLDHVTVATSGLVSVQVALSLDVATSITASGAPRNTVRKASVSGGSGIADGPLSFSGPTPGQLADPLGISCTQPAGSHVLYTLSGNQTIGSVTMVTTVSLVASLVVSPIIGPNFTLFSGTISPSISSNPEAYSLVMNASDQGLDLGAILPDQTPPVVKAGGPYTGVEGSSLSFDGSGSSDKCGPPTLAWTFGDGSTASGPRPSHTYAEEGTYAAGLTATNVTGLSSSTTFNVVVADAALNAAGRTIISTQVFAGTVASFTDADPAGVAADYTASINWGDGTTGSGIVAAGASAFTVTGSHTFATRALGPQTITVKVCDAGGSCATATSQALVFTYTTGGSFVVGDSSAGTLAAGSIGTGNAVAFWGAQWANANSLSGGGAPSSFKGFSNNPVTPICGSSWSAATGNSTPPPAAVPTYTAMIVTSSASSSGPQIAGDTAHIVIVKTDSGYAPNPGHAGTGVIVGVLC